MKKIFSIFLITILLTSSLFALDFVAEGSFGFDFFARGEENKNWDYSNTALLINAGGEVWLNDYIGLGASIGGTTTIGIKEDYQDVYEGTAAFDAKISLFGGAPLTKKKDLTLYGEVGVEFLNRAIKSELKVGSTSYSATGTLYNTILDLGLGLRYRFNPKKSGFTANVGINFGIPLNAQESAKDTNQNSNTRSIDDFSGVYITPYIGLGWNFR